MSTPDFFGSHLEAMIDLRHPLAVLSTSMPWTSIEATLAPWFERRAREGRVGADIDLFGVAFDQRLVGWRSPGNLADGDDIFRQ